MLPEFVVVGAGDVKRSAGLPLVEMVTARPIVPEHDTLRPMNRFTHRHVYSDNCSCPIVELFRFNQIKLCM